MNLGDIITRVQRTFGDTSGALITQDDVIRWANDAQVDLLKRTELNQVDYSTPSIKGTDTYSPTNAIFVRRVEYDGTRLQRSSLENIDSLDRARDYNLYQSPPQFFYVLMGNVVLYPIPDLSGKNIVIKIVQRPPALTASQDVPILPAEMHEDLVRYCLMRAKELDEDWAAAAYFEKDYAARAAESAYETFVPNIDTYPTIRDDPSDRW